MLKPLLVLSLLTGASAEAGMTFVCSADLELSQAEVRAALLGERPAVKVVDNAAAKREMLAFLGLTEKRYASIWHIKSFREGAAIPPIKSNDSEVIEHLKATPGSMGYVSAQPHDSGIHLCF